MEGSESSPEGWRARRSRGASARSPAGVCSCRPSACSPRWSSSASPPPSSGPQGWLPEDGAQARPVLDRYGLQLVGGFVPVVVHEATSTATRTPRARPRSSRRPAASCSSPRPCRTPRGPRPSRSTRTAGAARASSSTCSPSSRRGGRRAGAPPPRRHDPGDRAATSSSRSRTRDVPWCLDTGHLLIGGVDPVQFATQHAERIGHVHFKDVDAQRRRAPAQRGARPHAGRPARPVPASGSGDARIDEVVEALRHAGYERWLVLEQDLAITGSEPPVGGGPALGCRHEHRVPFHPGSGGGGQPMKRLTGTLAVALAAVTVAACGTAQGPERQPGQHAQRGRRRRAHAGQRPHDRDGHPQRRGLVLVGRQEGRRGGGQGRGRQARSGARRTTTRRRRRS